MASIMNWVVRSLALLPPPLRRALDAWAARRAQQRRARRAHLLRERLSAK